MFNWIKEDTMLELIQEISNTTPAATTEATGNAASISSRNNNNDSRTVHRPSRKAENEKKFFEGKTRCNEEWDLQQQSDI